MSHSEADLHLAKSCADRMWEADPASRGMGMALDSVAPGEAVLSMTVAASMLGAGGVCNRGYIFSLADSAMAFASCTHGQTAVAQMCDIAFDQDVGVDTPLTARATERHRVGRKAIYDVRVATRDGLVVAEFRGQTIALDAPPRLREQD